MYGNRQECLKIYEVKKQNILTVLFIYCSLAKKSVENISLFNSVRILY
jgi:hypothetical protein